jgi:flagellar basal body P-ring formation protein FlgA
MMALRTHMVSFKMLTAALAVAAGLTVPAKASGPVAVVPNEVVYPGQEIDIALMREVEVTNPNIRADYISSMAELEGAVARRTLLPGRVIPTSAVRASYAVERGQPVKLVYSSGGLVITASGSPLKSAAIGDFIQVRNLESGSTVSGTVMANGTVQVISQ